MQYELLKELKLAGFPQESRDSIRWDSIVYLDTKPQDTLDSSAVSLVTLSELMDACGEGYIQLSNNPTLSDRKWGAYFRVDLNDKSTEGFGEAKDEAVARLWLALNIKERQAEEYENRTMGYSGHDECEPDTNNEEEV